MPFGYFLRRHQIKKWTYCFQHVHFFYFTRSRFTYLFYTFRRESVYDNQSSPLICLQVQHKVRKNTPCGRSNFSLISPGGPAVTFIRRDFIRLQPLSIALELLINLSSANANHSCHYGANKQHSCWFWNRLAPQVCNLGLQICSLAIT